MTDKKKDEDKKQQSISHKITHFSYALIKHQGYYFICSISWRLLKKIGKSIGNIW